LSYEIVRNPLEALANFGDLYQQMNSGKAGFEAGGGDMRSMTLMLAAVAAQLAPADAVAQPAPKAERGSVRFEPRDAQNTPSVHRLDPHSFDFELKPKSEAKTAGFTVSTLTFPSPEVSPHPENNTVHAEYFRPNGPGPFPAVIVLDILAGDQAIARMFSTVLAQNGVAALSVHMAYYGPRRPPNSKARLLSLDIPRTLSAVRQTVLDLRRAVAWLESRKEIDGQKLGVLGTSLGSFMAALTAEAEPKISKVALLFGGGGFVEGYYDHPQAKPFMELFQALGITKELMKQALANVDPLTHADKLKNRDVLMIAARRDDIVPPKMAEAMWNATGKPKIVWYNTTHVGGALFIVPATRHVVEHFKWK